MSKEYIEKEATIRNFCKGCGLFDTDNCVCTGSVRCDEYDAILDTPPADVKPVSKGKWIFVLEGVLSTTYRCSHCGNYFAEHSDTLNAGRGDKNYCPNCGADMREEKEDGRI